MCFIQRFPNGSSSATGFLALRCRVKVPQLRECWCFAMSDTAVSIPNLTITRLINTFHFSRVAFFLSRKGGQMTRGVAQGGIFVRSFLDRGLSQLLWLLKVTMKLLKSFYHFNPCLHLCVGLQLDCAATFTCLTVNFSFSGLGHGA